jgi:signal peptidase I
MCYIPPMKSFIFSLLFLSSISCPIFAQNCEIKTGLADWSQGRGLVAYTGSMKPFFVGGERYIWTKVPYSSLQVGHIVLYKASWTSSVVIHRIKARHVTITGRVIYTMRGDSNMSNDPEYLTERNYIGAFSYRTN